MYNLIISGTDLAWDLPVYEFHPSRFLEYTTDILKTIHTPFTAQVLADLKSYPSLFLYEQYRGVARIGYIREIKDRGTAIAIEYVFDQDIPPIPADKIRAISSELGIDEYRGEQFRTHWAVKQVDLLSILNKHGLAAPFVINSVGVSGRLEEMRFKVAFSFPGELRTYVQAVSDYIKNYLPAGSVFYDDDFTAQLARPNLDSLLQTVYLNNSDLIVVFLSADYERKMWCGIEWRAVRSFINNRSDETVMLVRADNSNIPGVFPHDGYIDMSRFSPEQIGNYVLERVRLQRV